VAAAAATGSAGRNRLLYVWYWHLNTLRACERERERRDQINGWASSRTRSSRGEKRYKKLTKRKMPKKTNLVMFTDKF
jgi:hypothetical protein